GWEAGKSVIEISRSFGCFPGTCFSTELIGHMAIVKGITEGSYHRVNQLAITHALTPTCTWDPVLAAAHHLGSAADRHFGITQINGLSRRDNRLQTAAT